MFLALLSSGFRSLTASFSQLRLTPVEAERLRKISYQKQLEAGMRHPGRAGLTSDRLGDAEKWYPGPSASSDAASNHVSIPK